ncbi:hypothetical protein BGW36DRAFT_433460 [Talaromyces proteolyticus]|uniref:Hemerythrin-like domain-containing protein n=1 Tax=Talaromyces proteolyticus TaxID=1131652 RepID=A0AAD4PUK1_9EURO|nr:uncharacterized protein BGW36DRAFT_433460 [Talaromyces proteolyticus]KAH8689460.1 hypothetical protein BGW36DRAFT_433460 [Talaromyces proteolyticus]
MSSTNVPLSLIPTPGGEPGADPHDPFVEFASHMALVHNIIIRGFNSMYLQAPKVKDVDIPDFVRYCDAWYEFTIGHHDSEERVLFPEIEAASGVKGIMDEDVEEHVTFHHGLDDFKAYISPCLADSSKFSGTEFVKVLDCFASEFHRHMSNEPLKLLSLSKYSFDMKDIGDRTTQYALKRYSTTDVLPVLWYNLDTKFENGLWESFPPLPAPVKWSMVNILGWWRSNWWRFSSCNAQLVEREDLLCLRPDY